MLEGRTLPSSSLPRWIVDEFRIEGLITGITSGSRISYRLTDSVAFSRYISDNYTSGTSLERWIEIFSGDNKDLQRSTLVQETAYRRQRQMCIRDRYTVRRDSGGSGKW